MLKKKLLSPRTRNDYLVVWGPVVAVTLAGFLIAWKYVEPAPPEQIRIASGSEDGAYYAFARRYRTLLEPSGITLEIVKTAGSIENLRLLSEGRVDLAFVQGGTVSAAPSAGLESIASLYFEPLWVFHRKPLVVTYLSDLKGRRVATGPEGSGTRVLAKQFLADNGVTEQTATLLSLDSHTAAEQLKNGEVDVAFFVSSPRGPTVAELLTAETVGLMNFRRHLAYQRKYRFLSTVVLGEGTVDLVRNIPPQDTFLPAPAATLVAREDLHPALVPLILDAATQVHESGGLFEEPNMFPSNKFTELPMHSDARRYLRSGPGILYEIFPFWAASLMDRMKIMLLPLLTLLIPLIKVAPPVYRWRIRSRIYRWYRVLREVDLKLKSQSHSPGLREEIDRLNALETEIGDISVPAAYMEEFYNLRMHIDLLREKLGRETALHGSRVGREEQAAGHRRD